MHLACCSCCCFSLMVLAAMLVGSEDTWLPLVCFRLAHGQKICDWLFMKTVSDPFWGFSYLCFSWLFPWSWYLSAQLPRWAWPCLPSARCVAFWGMENPQSSLCHCPQVWHFSQSLKAISNLGAAGYESMQVGFSQLSSPSLVPFVSFIYLKNKTADS